MTSGLLNGLGNVTLTELEIFRTGLSLSNLTLDPVTDLSVGDFFEITDVTLQVSNFVIDTSADPAVSGTITLAVGGIELFTNGDFVSAGFSNLNAIYGFGLVNASGQLVMTLDGFILQIGEAVRMDATQIAIRPGQTVLASIGTATLSSPLFSGAGNSRADEPGTAPRERDANDQHDSCDWSLHSKNAVDTRGRRHKIARNDPRANEPRSDAEARPRVEAGAARIRRE